MGSSKAKSVVNTASSKHIPKKNRQHHPLSRAGYPGTLFGTPAKKEPKTIPTGRKERTWELHREGVQSVTKTTVTAMTKGEARGKFKKIIEELMGKKIKRLPPGTTVVESPPMPLPS